MKDKIVLITGSTDGIGKQTAIELAEKGALVLVHGRNKGRGESTVEEIKEKTGSENIKLFTADFSSLSEVRKLADEIKSDFDHLDVLINNAGVYLKKRELSKDGYEMTFAVNHLAPFLLTNLLLDLIKKSNYSRIINVSSMAHQRSDTDFDNLQGEKHYDAYGAYGLSKLGNILFTKSLAEKLSGTGVTVNALHPGVIGTKLLWAGFSMSGGSLKQGAETPVYLASSPEVEGVTGRYFNNKKEASPASITDDKNLRNKFWKVSEELTGLKTC